jgi:ABC-type uncharacterized transport system ATPase component
MINDKLRVTLISVLAGLVAIIVIGIVVLIAIGRDAQQVTTFAFIVLPVLITAAGLGTLQVSNSQKLDAIGKNVNGNSTKLIKAVTGERSLADGELESIQADVDKLPSHDEER